jgi:amino acid transporter
VAARRGKTAGEPPAGRSLDRTALSPLRILAIAVAGISPTTSVFLTYGTGLGLSGTGVIWAFILGALVAVAVAFCYAEVGSAYPSAGGGFAIIHRALGKFWGGVASVLFLCMAILLTAAILDVGATFISALVPGGVPVGPVGFGLLVVVTVLSVGRISPASWVAAAMLILEVVVILTFIGFAFAHPALHANPFTHPRLYPGGHLVVAFGAGALFGGAVPALLALNGYDSPLYMAEETEQRRALPYAVLASVAISIVTEVLAVIAATYALPRNPAPVVGSSSPMSDIATATMGSTGAKLLLVGVVIAIFDAGLVSYIVMTRILFDAARRGVWPGRPVNRLVAHIGRSQVPLGACLVLFVGAGIFTLWSSVTALVTFTSVMLILIYMLVAVAALVTRWRSRRNGVTPPFRMPAWPLLPLIALAGGVLCLTQQTSKDFLITGIIVAVAVVYHGWQQISQRKRADDWKRADPVPALDTDGR